MITKDIIKVIDNNNDVTMYSMKYYSVQYDQETGVGSLMVTGKDTPLCMVIATTIELDRNVHVFSKVEG
jgi:hypothetical protein